MNKLVHVIFFLKTISAFGQEELNTCQTKLDTLTGLTVYISATETASYPGGMEAIARQIGKRIIVPKSDNTRDGFKVFVAFIVQSDGTVVGQRIVRNISGTNLAEQFLDIIDDVLWKPGSCNGRLVSTLEIIPMSIKL